jgi:hypothetical protein
MKDKAATTPGKTSSSTSQSYERLPRKAPGTGKDAGKDTAKGTDAKADQTASTHNFRPRPRNDADFQSLPRLQPMAPLSASPTIQLPRPIEMPPPPQ